MNIVDGHFDKICQAENKTTSLFSSNERQEQNTEQNSNYRPKGHIPLTLREKYNRLEVSVTIAADLK